MNRPQLCFEQAYKRLLEVPNSPKEGLSRILTLLKHLNNPQRQLSSIHIAGSNGKGSTAAFCQSILQTRFPKVALFTSPHLHCVCERIQINNTLISKYDFCRLEAQIHHATLQMTNDEHPTFFEKITAMAFLYFREQQVDYAVIEVGLGGRLDSTNVIDSDHVIITPIALDHQKFLGETLTEIAAEKAGIMKANSTVWSAAQNPEAQKQLKKKSAELNQNKLHFLDQLCTQKREQKQQLRKQIKLQMRGTHQKDNAILASLALYDFVFEDHISFHKYIEQILPVLYKTKWPGRYETLLEKPLTILDGAHNPHAAGILNDTLHADSRINLSSHHPLLLVIVGVSTGHSAYEFATCLKLHNTTIWCTKAMMPRSQDASSVQKDFIKAGYKQVYTQNFRNLFSRARSYAQKHNMTILITGSLYLVGEMREQILNPESPLEEVPLQGL